jgi:hypothetical protein
LVRTGGAYACPALAGAPGRGGPGPRLPRSLQVLPRGDRRAFLSGGPLCGTKRLASQVGIRWYPQPKSGAIAVFGGGFTGRRRRRRYSVAGQFRDLGTGHPSSTSRSTRAKWRPSDAASSVDNLSAASPGSRKLRENWALNPPFTRRIGPARFAKSKPANDKRTCPAFSPKPVAPLSFVKTRFPPPKPKGSVYFPASEKSIDFPLERNHITVAVKSGSYEGSRECSDRHFAKAEDALNGVRSRLYEWSCSKSEPCWRLAERSCSLPDTIRLRRPM